MKEKEEKKKRNCLILGFMKELAPTPILSKIVRLILGCVKELALSPLFHCTHNTIHNMKLFISCHTFYPFYKILSFWKELGMSATMRIFKIF